MPVQYLYMHVNVYYSKKALVNPNKAMLTC